MATAIRAEYCSDISVSNCSFSGFDNCIEMHSCSNFNVSSNGFFNSDNALFLANCYGKASVLNNYAYNVNNLIKISDLEQHSFLKPSSSISRASKLSKIKEKLTKNHAVINMKFNKKIKELLNLEAQERFFHLNTKKADEIKIIKAKYGSLQSKKALKDLFPEFAE